MISSLIKYLEMFLKMFLSSCPFEKYVRKKCQLKVSFFRQHFPVWLLLCLLYQPHVLSTTSDSVRYCWKAWMKPIRWDLESSTDMGMYRWRRNSSNCVWMTVPFIYLKPETLEFVICWNTTSNRFSFLVHDVLKDNEVHDSHMLTLSSERVRLEQLDEGHCVLPPADVSHPSPQW